MAHGYPRVPRPASSSCLCGGTQDPETSYLGIGRHYHFHLGLECQYPDRHSGPPDQETANAKYWLDKACWTRHVCGDRWRNLARLRRQTLLSHPSTQENGVQGIWSSTSYP